jgi:hypothetical protein
VKEAAASCQRACLFAVALASISQSDAKHQAEGIALLQRLCKDSFALWQEVAILSLAKPLADTGRIKAAFAANPHLTSRGLKYLDSIVIPPPRPVQAEDQPSGSTAIIRP